MAIAGGGIQGAGGPSIGARVKEHSGAVATPATARPLNPDVHGHLAETSITPKNHVFGPMTSGPPSHEAPNEPTTMKAKLPTARRRPGGY